MSLFTLTIGLSFFVVIVLPYRAVPHGPSFLAIGRSPSAFEHCLSSSLHIGEKALDYLSAQFGKICLILTFLSLYFGLIFPR